ncbi:MAG: nucleotidyltransferase family protein [Clostridia bacterium]|nr:nucleotidyltransferase family protein [Clostridia bacterium]
MNGLSKNSEHLIYLISCALRGAEAEESVLNGVNLENLFVLAQNHTVSAMVCMVLEKTEVFVQADPTVQKQWSDARNKAVRKNMLLDVARKTLMDEMENEGIWHTPLKGSILKDWYPQYGMREMADNDILFDETKCEQVKEIFLKHGYFVESFNKGNHDVYQKPPIYNFEMHRSLFSESNYEDLAEKYADVKEKLIPDENKKYQFHFTPEDFYIFVMAHAYKHYSDGGTGIRTLADIYVMNHRSVQLMNRDYVEGELKALGILDYEENSRLLSEKIFDSDKPISEITLTDNEQEMLLYQLGVGTYGTFENLIKNKLNSMRTDNKPISGFTKFRYCIKRLFPGRKWCKDRYPFVYKHPYIMPVFWVWRWFKKIPATRNKIRKELAILKSSK